MGAVGENFPNKTFLSTTGRSRKKCCVKKDMYLLINVYDVDSNEGKKYNHNASAISFLNKPIHS